MSKNASEDAYYDETYWLEYLERELDPGLQKDLQLLLKNSSKDREIFESVETTKMLVKASDEVAMPESGHYYERLHDKIMASLEQEQAKPSLETVVKELTRKFSSSLKELQET